jgi:hypothetical protein
MKALGQAGSKPVRADVAELREAAIERLTNALETRLDTGRLLDIL